MNALQIAAPGDLPGKPSRGKFGDLHAPIPLYIAPVWQDLIESDQRIPGTSLGRGLLAAVSTRCMGPSKQERSSHGCSKAKPAQPVPLGTDDHRNEGLPHGSGGPKPAQPVRTGAFHPSKQGHSTQGADKQAQRSAVSLSSREGLRLILKGDTRAQQWAPPTKNMQSCRPHSR